MVIGGRSQKQTEIIDLTDSSVTCTSAFGELESRRWVPLGGLINETPLLCGGELGYEDGYDSCIVFGHPKTMIKLKEKRRSAFSVMLNETTFWIMGGYYSNTTEFITLGATTSVYGPPLPKFMAAACAVKYNDTHIYVTDGSSVWIYNTVSSSWKEGPGMNVSRYGHGCTVLHYQQIPWLVVAASWNSGSGSKSVEILDPNMNKWIHGENNKKYHFSFRNTN